MWETLEQGLEGVYATAPLPVQLLPTPLRRFVNPPPGARSRRFEYQHYRGGAYFVTTNTRKREPLFGAVEQGRMYLSAYGKIVAEEWQRTGVLREKVSLDAFSVMPDHVHALLWIHHPTSESKREENREANHTLEENQKSCQSRKENPEMPLAKSSRESPPGLEKRRAGTLSTIIGSLKAAVTRRINEKRDTPGESVTEQTPFDGSRYSLRFQVRSMF